MNKLGTEAYGIFAIVMVVIGYFGFLELGLGKATIKYVSEYYAKNDIETIRKVIGAALCVYFIMGIVGVVLIISLTDLLVFKILKVPYALKDTSKLVFYIAAIGFLINMPSNVFGSIPKALQRFDITNKVDIVMGSLQILLSVYLLYLGYFLKEMVILNVFISLASIIVYIVLTKKLLPTINFRFKFDKDTFKLLFKFGGYVALDNMLITLSARINQLIIGIYLPISYVAFYVVPHSIVSKVSFIPGSISQATFPAFSELSNMSQKVSLQDLYLRSTKYIVILTVPFIVLFTVFAEKFLYFWMGEEFAQKGTLLLQILGIAHIVTYWCYSAIDGLRGVNRPEISTKIQVVLAVMNIVFCFLFIPRIGIVGAALAWSLHRFILLPIFIYFVGSRVFHIEIKRLWNSSFKKSFILGALILLMSFIFAPFINSLYLLIAIFFLISLFYLALSYVFVLDTSDKDFVFEYIRKNIMFAKSS